MLTLKKDNQLSEGTALIVLRETSSNKKFTAFLNSLGMTYNEAFIKMKKAKEDNLRKYYPKREKLKSVATLHLRKSG